MKNFLALCLSCCLSLCIFSVPVFAMETVNLNTELSITETSVNSTITPREVELLWSADGTWFIDSYTISVTPEKGKNLKIIFAATDVCKIDVTKNGGWWPSTTINYDPNSGTQTIDLIENCNGEPYTIKFTNNTGVTIIARVVQSDYS